MNQYFGFTNVLIYAGFPVISVGLEYILKRLDCKFIAKSNNFNHVISLLLDTSKEFDVLIIDCAGSDQSTLQSIDRIKAIPCAKPVRILVLIDEDELKQFYLPSGIETVIKKQAGIQELVEAIQAVLLGKPYHEPKSGHTTATHGGYHWNSSIERGRVELSEREDQVIDLLVQGFSQREISRKLTLQHTTIATYKKRALDKLGAKSIGELLFLGWQ